MAELAPITTYATLKAAVLAMADNNNAEYADSLPLFIQQAETKLFQRLRCPGNEKRAVFLASEGDNTVAIDIPTDYLEAKLVYYGTKPLGRITDQKLSQLYDGSATTSVPTRFARNVGQLTWYPRASENDDVTIVYYEFQGPLSDTVTWTKMLRVDPFVYLYGALAEGARFMRDAEEEAKWQGLFENSLALLNDQGYANEVAGSTVVDSDVAHDLAGGW